MPWKGNPFGWGVPAPFLTFLPEPQDATINVLRQLRDHLETGESNGGTIDVSINYIEPPSIDLVADLMFQAFNTDMTMNRKIQSVPKPDPRKSKAKFKLWKYKFKKAQPAVPRPAEKFIKACARLASAEYDYNGNWDEAGQLAEQIDPEQIPDTLAVMVHPPRVENATDAWEWLQRVQLASAQIVANIELRNQIPLEKSALVEITNGPIDWTIDAAIIALAQRARREPELSEAVCHQLFHVVERLPESGYWSNFATALENILLLPNLPSDVADEVQQSLAAIYAN